jgi:hypothetical protein
MLVSATARADQPFAEPQPASAATPLQRKEEAEDRAFRAFVVGSLTAAVPFSVGTMVTTSSHEQDAQNAGVYTLQGGLLVAPLVSHAMLGEWKRGLLFSIAPLAGSGSMVALLAVHPDAVSHAALDVQRMYYFMVVASVLGGGIGVVDTLFHPSREALREPVRPPGSLGSLRVSPILSPGNYGLSVGGAL